MAFTNHQNKVINTFNELIKKETENYILLGLEARNSIIKLPVKNENGEPVINSDNVKMSYIMNHYLDIARSAFPYLDEIDQKYLNEKYPSWSKGFYE